jgi:hypothetical protein
MEPFTAGRTQSSVHPHPDARNRPKVDGRIWPRRTFGILIPKPLSRVLVGSATRTYVVPSNKCNTVVVDDGGVAMGKCYSHLSAIEREENQPRDRGLATTRNPPRFPSVRASQDVLRLRR